MALGLYEELMAESGLPHPSIPLAVFLVVEQAIRAAWKLRQAKPSERFRLAAEVEDDVTYDLVERVTNEVFNRGIVPGFDAKLIRKPTRETKVSNFDESKRDLMPDMLFDLVDRPPVFKPSQDWLFIECKPVQAGRAAGAHYCDRGIARFVRGDYAWAMTSALMVGYVTARYTIASKLTAALNERRAALPTTSFPKKCPRSPKTEASEPTHITQHRRTFRYVQTGAQAPPIALRHLWLRRD
jgi:hypothetical protein